MIKIMTMIYIKQEKINEPAEMFTPEFHSRVTGSQVPFLKNGIVRTF